jgi:ATP-dependent DNA helicase RecQ
LNHRTFGDGSIVRYEADKVVVLFEEAGYKTFSLDLVRYEELLRGR